jgi:hypothetical protein
LIGIIVFSVSRLVDGWLSAAPSLAGGVHGADRRAPKSWHSTVGKTFPERCHAPAATRASGGIRDNG